MPEDLLVECCAPTLAGLKTGSLFACPCPDRQELVQDLRSLNRRLHGRGLRILPMRYSENRALLYLFRPEKLRRDLQDNAARSILDRAGYGDLGTDACVLRLMRRLRDSDSFPHEVGLFLSYPPEDVLGFIVNKAKNYKFIGAWKVYGDEAQARRTFECYQKCTDSYRRQHSTGVPVERLAVAVTV